MKPQSDWQRVNLHIYETSKFDDIYSPIDSTKATTPVFTTTTTSTKRPSCFRIRMCGLESFKTTSSSSRVVVNAASASVATSSLPSPPVVPACSISIPQLVRQTIDDLNSFGASSLSSSSSIETSTSSSSPSPSFVFTFTSQRPDNSNENKNRINPLR